MLISILTRLTQDRRAITAMTFAVMATVLMGFAGLATETGLWYVQRAAAQGAADQGAIAAAVVLQRGGGAPDQTAIDAADNAAKRNYPRPADLTVTTAILQHGDPDNSVWPIVRTTVSVAVIPVIARLFLSDVTALTIETTAVATLKPIGTACVLATSGDLSIEAGQLGNACSYASNSGGAAAISVSASPINVYALTTSGGCANCPPPSADYFSRPPASWQPPVDNPYPGTIGRLTLPPANYTCIDPAEDTDTLIPAAGTAAKPVIGGAYWAYCQDRTLTGRTYLSPGVYFFINAALTVADGSSMECRWDGKTGNVCDYSGGGGATGVTLVFTGTGGTSPALTIAPTAKVQLSAPRQNDPRSDLNFLPALHGTLFYRDPRLPPGNPAASIVGLEADSGAAGDSTSAPTYTRLNGLMYFPGAAVIYGANGVAGGGESASVCATLVAGTIRLAGQPSVFQDCADAGYLAKVPRVMAVRLME